jgi:hypothetical protein
MLLPTHEAMRTEGGWREWAPRWLHLWQQLDHCRYWDSLWFALFARLAKHDVHGGWLGGQSDAWVAMAGGGVVGRLQSVMRGLLV